MRKICFGGTSGCFFFIICCANGVLCDDCVAECILIMIYFDGRATEDLV